MFVILSNPFSYQKTRMPSLYICCFNTLFKLGLRRITSTWRFSNCSRCLLIPTRFNRLGFMSTHTSTSLFSFCSSLAKEPKSNSERTPYFSVRNCLVDLSFSMHSAFASISLFDYCSPANIQIIIYISIYSHGYFCLYEYENMCLICQAHIYLI